MIDLKQKKNKNNSKKQHQCTVKYRPDGNGFFKWLFEYSALTHIPKVMK
jgi:hypothetical protein